MPVEFIGMIHTNDGSESRPQTTPLLDPDFTRRHAQAHEDAGFDRVLIGYGSSWPEGTQVAAHVAAHTQRLGLLIAHRPGFVFPTLAARQFATLDQFSGGRVAVHVITGGNDEEQRRDGDYLAKDERYARTDEYLQILRRSWTLAEAISFGGRFYRFEGYRPGVRPVRPAGIPLFFGGSSSAAYQVGGRHADTFALWGEPLKETAEQIASVQAAAAAAGRPAPGISVSFRPILGATEDLAWARAHRILDAIENPASHAAQRRGWPGTNGQPENTGSQRLLAAAARGDLHDRALWTATARASGAAGNSTALVGTPDTVAQALLDYVDLGVTTLLIRGYDPLEDATDYGRELIPLVRAEVARRDAARAGAAEPGAEAELAGRS
ncbi:MAG: LLM class flavin-dependent oxidoreductase [Streptosporangiaceae bacterium]